MKKYIIGSVLAALVIATFATLPQIDSVQPDALFYLKNLTPLFFVSIIATVTVAIKYRRSLLGLFSVALLGLLVLWTPNVMMVQPWFLDSYPFTAEAVVVAQTGHLANYHFLSMNPMIGLVMGPFLSVTGVSALMLQKLYSAFLAISLVVFIYLIAKAAKLKKDVWVIAPLLFVSIAWPNEFHLSRQSFSLVFYVAAWFLLLTLIFKKFDRRVFGLLILDMFLVVMAHPATSLFLLVNLAAVGIYGQLRHKFDKKDLGIVVAAVSILSIFWGLWNTLVTTEAITNIISIGNNLISNLMNNPQEITGLGKLFSGYSPIYSFLINVRLLETLGIFASAFLVLIVTFRRRVDDKILVVLVGWTVVNVLSAIPLLYSGLSFFARPALFSFISWAVIGALAFGMLIEKPGRLKLAKKPLVYGFLVIFIIVPLILIPVIKYSPIPFLYPSSEELAMKDFSDLHPALNAPLVYLEYNLPYGISYVRSGVNETDGYVFGNIYVPGEGLDSVMAGTSVLWVTRSITMRDAFYDSTPSMTDIVNNLSIDSITHNKVYDAGQSQWILTPTFVNSAYFGRLNVTSLSCSPGSGAVVVGGDVSVSGSLLAGSVGVSGRAVSVTYHVFGQDDVVHIQTTNATGGYSDSFKPNVAGSWGVSAVFAGDASYTSSSTAVQPFSANLVTVLCSVSPDSVIIGRNVSVSGSLLAGSVGVSGRTVIVEYLLLGQADFVHTVITGVSGGFSDSFAPNLAGNWTVRASFAGDASYAGSSSTLQLFSANW